MAFKHNDPCRDKAADDEPIFTLRAKDPLAVRTILRWCDEAASCGIHLEKLDEAKQCAELMREWRQAHIKGPSEAPNPR